MKINIDSYLKNFKSRKIFLFGAVLLLLIIVFVFLIILPLNHSIRLNSIAVKNQKAILNYILKYTSKIKSIKSAAGTANLPPLSGASAVHGKSKEYMKFISSMFQYFNIDKSQISKFYSRYASALKKGKVDRSKKETVFISLKGLSLNQCINLIYALSDSSGKYGAHIISISMKKNFTNDKLLNLKVNIVRRQISQ